MFSPTWVLFSWINLLSLIFSLSTGIFGNDRFFIAIFFISILVVGVSIFIGEKYLT